MVNACPPQSDPRPKVEDFVSNSETKAISGLVTEGLDSLLEVVMAEIRRQQPDSNVILVDRELLSEENITFARELSDFVERELSDGRKLNLIFSGDIPIIGWNMAIERFKGRNICAYYGVLACRQVPLCSKIDL